MDNRKRQRAQNFSPMESRYFLEVIKKYKHIIDNKNTSTIINEKKRRAWISLTDEYNSNTHYLARSTKMLMNAYRNHKNRSKMLSGRKKVISVGRTAPKSENPHVQDEDFILLNIERCSEDGHVEYIEDENVLPCKESDPLDGESCTSIAGTFPAIKGNKDEVTCSEEGESWLLPDKKIPEQKFKSLTVLKLADLCGSSRDSAGRIELQQHLADTSDHTESMHCSSLTDENLDKISGSDFDASTSKPSRKVVESFLNLSKAKKQLLDLQTRIAEGQLKHQRKLHQLEVEHMKNKIDFEKQKHELEMSFLKEKSELELGFLLNN